MLKPSYAELMDVLNKNTEGENISSRYTIVIAAAKRARQLIDGDEPMIENYNEGKPVTTAVEELYEGKIQIVGEGEGTVLNLKKKKDVEAEVKAEIKENQIGEEILPKMDVDALMSEDDEIDENSEVIDDVDDDDEE